MRIGFIGLGGMGRPMVEHLLAAGHELHVWARRPASADFLPTEVPRAASPAELARQCEIVCTNVTSSADVAGLAAQLIEGFAPGGLHIDFSTIAPAVARALAARYVERGIDFVDAPVSGGTAGARAKTLAIMWGGREELSARLEPLFACIGKTAVHVGAAGAGQVAKACNQLIMVSVLEATAEAARLASAAGIDFARVRTALLGGSAGSRVLDLFGDKMAARDFTAGVEARLHHKDFALTLGEATQQSIPMPVGGAVLQQLNALMAAGWGRDDTSRLLCVLERANQ